MLSVLLLYVLIFSLYSCSTFYVELKVVENFTSFQRILFENTKTQRQKLDKYIGISLNTL